VSAPDAPVAARAIPCGVLRTTLALIVILGLTPVVAAVLAIRTSALMDCKFDLGTIASCPLGPADPGPALHAVAMFGWFAFMTGPIAIALFVVWIAVALAFVARRWLARKGLVRV